MIPVFVIARDRLSYLKRTIASLSQQRDAHIYVVDHGTTDPETIDWLRHDCPFTVFWHGDRRVHDFWSWDSLRNLVGTHEYAVTDPDIDFTGVPEDLIAICQLALIAFPHIMKAGPALRLDDLPNTDLAKRVKNWEIQFWDRNITSMAYEAPIDTTFAVYRPLWQQPVFQLGPGIRIVGPYQVRHMPWYETGPADEELRYYREHAREGASHWPPED